MGVKPMTREYFQEAKQELLDLNYSYPETEGRVMDAIERLEATVENGGWAETTDDEINDWAWRTFRNLTMKRSIGYEPTVNLGQAIQCVMDTDHNLAMHASEEDDGAWGPVKKFRVFMRTPTPALMREEIYVGSGEEEEVASAIMRYLYEKEKEQ